MHIGSNNNQCYGSNPLLWIVGLILHTRGRCPLRLRRVTQDRGWDRQDVWCHLIISPTLLSSGLDASRQPAVTDCRFPTHFRYLIVRFVRKTQNTWRSSFFAYVVDWLSGSTMICGVEKCLDIRTYIWLRIGVSIEQCRTLSTNRKYLKSWWVHTVFEGNWCIQIQKQIRWEES